MIFSCSEPQQGFYFVVITDLPRLQVESPVEFLYQDAFPSIEWLPVDAPY
jgi:hypothetical protein